MIFFGNINLSTQNANEAGRTDKNVVSNSMGFLKTENSSQVDMQKLEKNISEKVRCEVHNVVAALEIRVHDAILSGTDNPVIPGVEFAIGPANANPSSVVLNPDQRAFSVNTDDLHVTAPSRFNSNTNLERIVETRGNFSDEAGNLLVSEREFDWQTYTHHSYLQLQR